MSLKRKYVDSHWLVFTFQGVIALLFGWFTLFSKVESVSMLVTLVGSTLLSLGIIELFNLLRRTHLRETWGLSLTMALVEIVTAFTLLFTLDMNSAFHLVIVAAYTVVRGLLEIALGIHSIDDRTDKFIWTLIGICGCIMGFVILNSGDFTESVNFVKVFGAYMSLFGIANMIYGVHNRDQAKEFAEARREAARKSVKNNDGLRYLKSAKPVSTQRTAISTKSTAKTSNSRNSGKSSAHSAKSRFTSPSSTQKSSRPAHSSSTQKSSRKAHPKSSAKKSTKRRNK